MEFSLTSEVYDHFNHPMAVPLIARAEGASLQDSQRVLITDRLGRSIEVHLLRENQFHSRVFTWDEVLKAWTTHLAGDSQRIRLDSVRKPYGESDQELLDRYRRANHRPLDMGDLVVPKDSLTTGNKVFGRIVAKVEYVKVNWSNGTSSEVPLDSLTAK